MASFATHETTTVLHAGAEQVTGPEYIAGALVFLLAVVMVGAAAHVVVGRVRATVTESNAEQEVGEDEASRAQTADGDEASGAQTAGGDEASAEQAVGMVEQ